MELGKNVEDGRGCWLVADSILAEDNPDNDMTGAMRLILEVIYGTWFLQSLLCPLPYCEKPGNEPEEAKLQNASKQIVQNAILRAVQQVSQESLQRGGRPSDCRPRGRLGGCELTKKHEKK
ncbi:A-kinase anchor protein inhibitor 1 isoform X1 [Cricetulus griseus]|uniref:A-kinase anchor protein inhibitor 1 isoform X1 n=1 Tax=Cricetulus griseus TaxID=10029 RepID=UPI00022F51C8|nr:A-kinase anchor protein inhibitor 1 isoform X1 [Cricetulus griseus]